jgi:hypothetical protein
MKEEMEEERGKLDLSLEGVVEVEEGVSFDIDGEAANFFVVESLEVEDNE